MFRNLKKTKNLNNNYKKQPKKNYQRLKRNLNWISNRYPSMIKNIGNSSSKSHAKGNKNKDIKHKVKIQKEIFQVIDLVA